MAPSTKSKPSSSRAQNPLAGKSVLITGGTTGIGRATAILLAEAGAKVLIFGRHEQELSDAMADLVKVGDDVYGLTADVAMHEDVLRVFEEVDRRFKRLDVLINNAALAADGIEDGEPAEWRYVVATNLIGPMACAREAVERMKRHGGHIINVGSLSADSRGAGSSIYTATKSGLQGFSEALGKELVDHQIKVTLVEPGRVGTDMQPGPPAAQRKKEQKGEMLTAEDIAECIRYCLVQPDRCDVTVVKIQPHFQEKK